MRQRCVCHFANWLWENALLRLPSLVFDKLTKTASGPITLDAILNTTCISPQDSNKLNILITFQLHKFSLRM